MDKNDPTWRAIFDDERVRWKAKSYADLRAALWDAIVEKSCCVHYNREELGSTYQVEVRPLENEPDYLHVLIDVFEPRGFLSLSEDFLRYADGRLDD